MTEKLTPGKPNPKQKVAKAKIADGPKALDKAIMESASIELASHDDLTLPDHLNRKINREPPATPEERAAYAARSQPPVDPTVDVNASDEAIAQAMAADEAAKKKAKASNRIGRLKEKKALEDIPEKFRAWDPDRSVFYDVRKPRKKEGIMTAVQTAATKAKTKTPVIGKKPTKVKVTTASKKGGESMRDIAVKLALRKNGVSRKEFADAVGPNQIGLNQLIENGGKALGYKMKIDKTAKPLRYLLIK